MMRWVLIVLLFIIGCSDPKDGSIYESKLTQQRFEIDVGDCKHLNDTIDMWNSIADSVSKDIGRTRKQALRDGDYKHIGDESLTTDRKCVGFEMEEYRKGIGMVKRYVIMGIDQFKEKFNPIN